MELIIIRKSIEEAKLIYKDARVYDLNNLERIPWNIKFDLIIFADVLEHTIFPEKILNFFVKEYLRKFGITKNVFETADYAFLLKEERKKDLLSTNNTFGRGDGKNVAICIKERANMEKREIYLKLLVDLIDYLHKKDYFVFLVSQTVGDDVLGQDLMNLVNKNIKLVPFGTEPRFIKSIYKNCEFIISNRIHGIIFAAGVGTPFISIAYEPKFQGVLDQLSYPGQLRFNDGTVTDKSLAKAIDFVIKNRASLSSQLSERLRVLENKAKLNIELLKKYL